MRKKALSTKLSLYLDDALGVREKSELETYLAEHPEAKKELEELRAVRNYLIQKAPLKHNDWFWPLLSLKLERTGKEEKNVLPFRRKFLPVAVPLSLAVAVIIGVGIFLQRDSLFKFYSEKKEQVQHAYESGIIQGKILPLFTNLNKDQVLQFALFGTLPLDAQAHTALRIDESKNSGYRIEIAKNNKQTTPAVTASEFYSALDMSPNQHQIVDSILGSAKERIQSSVFVGENNSLAIHAELVNFNKMVMSNIAAALRPPQRVRFKKYLEDRRAPFTFVANIAPPVAPQNIYRAINKTPANDRYLILTPDTICFSEITINMDSVRRSLEAAMSSLSTIQVRTHALIRRVGEGDFAPTSANGQFNIQSGADYFAIELQRDLSNFPEMPTYFKIIPRISRATIETGESRQFPALTNSNGSDSAFSVELKQDSVVMRFFKRGIRLPVPPDRAGNADGSRRTNRSLQSPTRRSIDLDSVIQDMSKPKTKERKYRNPYEL